MWNNGRETYKFNREQDKLKKQYSYIGMTEEQIQTMYDFDKAIFNGRRREARHTQRFDLSVFEEDNIDESKNPLLYKFTDKLTVDLDLIGLSRYSWLDELQDERLIHSIHKLTDKDKEILTKYVIDGYKWCEIARMENVKPQAIANRLKRIRKRLIKYNGERQCA